MTSAKPLFELKILLHPALLDTPIGCRAIELDRFVDTYARSDAQVKAAEDEVHQEAALYRLAWFARQAAVLHAIGDQPFPRLKRALENPELHLRAEKAIASGLLYQKGRTSLLKTKNEFFDPELVTLILKASRKAPTAAAFIDAVKTSFQGDPNIASLKAAKKPSETVKSWFAEPVEFEIWSGVREEPFTMDPELRFLHPAANPLWPFQFMLQVAFPEPPRYLKDGQDPGTYSDVAPFELAVQPRIQQLVLDAVNRDPAQAALVSKMREFATLQRMFRLALAGQFGDSFPIEKLAALAQTTGHTSPSTRTLRWNVRTGVLERAFFEGVHLAAASSTGGDVTQLAGCVAFLGARQDLPSIPQSEWKSRCSFSQSAESARSRCQQSEDPNTCRQAALLGELESMTAARELRRKLKVEADDQLARNQAGCGAIE